MGAATVVTLIGVGVIVVVLALYLITIALTLYRVHYNLGTIIVGINAICLQVSSVPKYVGIVMNDVLAIDQAAKQLLAWGGDPEDMVEDPVIARMTLQLQEVEDETEMAKSEAGTVSASQ